MAHGENAAKKGLYREYNSPRLPGWPSKGRFSKLLTARKERQKIRRERYLVLVTESYKEEV